jgi:hypothetical protein
MGEVRRFEFRFTPLYRLLALPFGVTASTSEVRVDATHLRIRFGPWRVRTPLRNVRSTTVTRSFSLLKSAGPAHLSFADFGMTCATNGEQGLCIRFREPVRGMEPFGALRHPAVTVTVEDGKQLARVLKRAAR